MARRDDTTIRQRVEPAEPASPWLTADQAAARMQVGMKTIYGLVKSSRLRAAKIGGGDVPYSMM